MPRYFFVILLTLLGVINAQRAVCQEKPSPEQLKIQISILTDQVNSLQKQLADRDKLLYQKYQETKIAEYEFQEKLLEINLQTFDEQSFQTHVVMWLVVFVVASGICFSAWQLWKATTLTGLQLDSNLEISAKNVRVTSSVVGVTVLTISVVFLYIYIKEVYAIRIIDPLNIDVSAPNASGSRKTLVDSK